MHIVFAYRFKNGRKTHETRNSFWNITEAYAFCEDLVKQGYTQDEHGTGWSRWSASSEDEQEPVSERWAGNFQAA